MGRYGAGIGFLTDGESVLTTYYPGTGDSFDRILGEGYFKKTVKGHQYEVEQTILAPFGDDPVVVSKVKITNHATSPADLRWVEYWGAQNIQFSYRSGMEAQVLGDPSKGAELRRAFSERFSHKFEKLPNGLTETQTFLGCTPQDEAMWQKIEVSMKDPLGPFGGHIHQSSPQASMEDLAPPPTFSSPSTHPPTPLPPTPQLLRHRRHRAPRWTLRQAQQRSHLQRPGQRPPPRTAPPSQANESKTIFFLYGYVPEGFKAEALIKKYSTDPAGILARSSAQWKKEASASPSRPSRG